MLSLRHRLHLLLGLLFAATPLACDEGSAAELPEGWTEAQRLEDFIQFDCEPDGESQPDESSAGGQGGATASSDEKPSDLGDSNHEVSWAAGESQVRFDLTNLWLRCGQDVEAFHKTDGNEHLVLIQPVDMNPTEVPRCSCAYSVVGKLAPLDEGPTTVTLYSRGDNINDDNQPSLLDQAELMVGAE